MDYIFGLYKKYGNKGYIGEDVTQLQHAIQCALLAENYCTERNSETGTNNLTQLQKDFIAGCFLHDVGHLIVFDNKSLKTMGSYGVMNHEKIGSHYLKYLGFNSNICEFVENHIPTKRYLISTDKSYFSNLSKASKKTFEYQGGPMSEEEIKKYRQNKLFTYHLKLREFDDKAKSTEKSIIDYINNMDYQKHYKQFIDIHAV